MMQLCWRISLMQFAEDSEHKNLLFVLVPWSALDLLLLLCGCFVSAGIHLSIRIQWHVARWANIWVIVDAKLVEQSFNKPSQRLRFVCSVCVKKKTTKICITSVLLSSRSELLLIKECDTAPRMAKRKSNVTVVTHYGPHFGNRLVCVSVWCVSLTHTMCRGDDKFNHFYS